MAAAGAAASAAILTEAQQAAGLPAGTSAALRWALALLAGAGMLSLAAAAAAAAIGAGAGPVAAAGGLAGWASAALALLALTALFDLSEAGGVRAAAAVVAAVVRIWRARGHAAAAAAPPAAAAPAAAAYVEPPSTPRERSPLRAPPTPGGSRHSRDSRPCCSSSAAAVSAPATVPRPAAPATSEQRSHGEPSRVHMSTRIFPAAATAGSPATAGGGPAAIDLDVLHDALRRRRHEGGHGGAGRSSALYFTQLCHVSVAAKVKGAMYGYMGAVRGYMHALHATPNLSTMHAPSIPRNMHANTFYPPIHSPRPTSTRPTLTLMLPSCRTR